MDISLFPFFLTHVTIWPRRKERDRRLSLKRICVVYCVFSKDLDRPYEKMTGVRGNAMGKKEREKAFFKLRAQVSSRAAARGQVPTLLLLHPSAPPP